MERLCESIRQEKTNKKKHISHSDATTVFCVPNVLLFMSGSVSTFLLCPSHVSIHAEESIEIEWMCVRCSTERDVRRAGRELQRINATHLSSDLQTFSFLISDHRSSVTAIASNRFRDHDSAIDPDYSI